MSGAWHRTMEELDAGLAEIRRAPADLGTLSLIVARPSPGERAVLARGELSVTEGLVGDGWKDRPSTRTTDGSPHPDMQLNVMSARVVALLAGDPERWRLAGDQLYVDLDLGGANLPAGTRLALGDGGALVEVTAQPHLGCHKFLARFGRHAMKFVNSPTGRELRLRGLNARVVAPGTIHVGDLVRKV